MDSLIAEFPFAAALPKREKSKLVKLMDLVAEMKAIQATEGTLLPLRFAAKVIGVSRQRVDELVQVGTIRRFDVDGHSFVTENSVVDFCKSERKSGRPFKAPTWKESLKLSRELLKGK